MIILITGTPGSGKTAHAVDLLLDMAGQRPVFADGIPDLAIEHQPCPPVPEWTHDVPDAASATGRKTSFTFPPNSIVVIDECQRVFRPRSAASKVPPEVAAFETHRHLGIDFILITQHPSLVDGNIRRLVGKHIHIKVTAFGRYRFEWAEVGDPDSRASRDCAARTKYKLPKRAFSQYKSAELHTKNRIRLPNSVYVFGGALLMLVAAGWYVVNSIGAKLKPETGAITALTAPAGQPGPSGKVTTMASRPADQPMTAAEYVEHYKPRLTGLQHTAPAYDEITRPVDAPIPVGCIKRVRTGDCRCYDQQGNHYRTTVQVCETVLNEGLFFAWKMASASSPVGSPPPPSSSASRSPAGTGHVIATPFAGGTHNHGGALSPPPPRSGS